MFVVLYLLHQPKSLHHQDWITSKGFHQSICWWLLSPIVLPKLHVTKLRFPWKQCNIFPIILPSFLQPRYVISIHGWSFILNRLWVDIRMKLLVKKSKPYSLYYHHILKKLLKESVKESATEVSSPLTAEVGEVGSAVMISILIFCLFGGSTDLEAP